MAREINLSGYLPDILKDILEFKKITEAENPEFNLIFNKIDIALDNCFVDTLDVYGCARWEEMLAIATKETDDLQLRRLRIKAALNGDRLTQCSVLNKN